VLSGRCGQKRSQSSTAPGRQVVYRGPLLDRQGLSNRQNTASVLCNTSRRQQRSGPPQTRCARTTITCSPGHAAQHNSDTMQQVPASNPPSAGLPHTSWRGEVTTTTKAPPHRRHEMGPGPQCSECLPVGKAPIPRRCQCRCRCRCRCQYRESILVIHGMPSSAFSPSARCITIHAQPRDKYREKCSEECSVDSLCHI
jgi:hypothetical protein